jgi:hypothetical protein
VKPDGNYVEIVLAAPSGKPETQLLRAALKDIEAQVPAQGHRLPFALYRRSQAPIDGALQQALVIVLKLIAKGSLPS